MEQNLICMLREITEEEQRILNGEKEVQKSIYTADTEFTVDSKRMLEDSNLITIRTHTRFIHFPLHRHNYVEVIYVCEGSVVNRIEGKEVEIHQGELLFLNQFTFHEILPARETDIAINFIILPEFFDVAYAMVGTDNVLADFLVNTLRQNHGKGEYLYFKVADVLPIQNLMENMIHSLVYHQGRERMINQTTMGLLFLYLMESVQYAQTAVPDKYENMILMTTLNYIEHQYQTAALTELCEMVHQPMHQLSRLIKSSTGYNFMDLLKRKRLNKAVELLCETDMTVNDIILQVGYENRSYFHRIFKVRYHKTPKAFRDAAKKECTNKH